MSLQFEFGLIAEIITAKPDEYKSVLSRFADCDTPPTFAGRTVADRRHFDIDRETARVATMASSFEYLNDYVKLFRTRPVKYTAHLTVSSHTANAIALKSSCRPKDVPELTTLLDELASGESTVLAYLNRTWSSEEATDLTEQERNEVNGLGSDSAESLYRTGPSGIAMISWFGPLLIDKIGRNRLLSIGAKVGPRPSMMRVDLGETPWVMSPREVLTRKRDALTALRPCGAFALVDYSLNLNDVYANRKAGPSWTSPPWRMHRQDFA